MHSRIRSAGAVGALATAVLVLSGCVGTATAPAQPSTPSGDGGGEVRVLINSGGNATWLEAAIPVFEEANPEYDIVLDVQEAGVIRDSMVQLYASDETPDLALAQWATPQYQTLVEAGAFTDLSSVWRDSGLIDNTTDAVVAAWTSGDAQFGIPMTKTWFPVLFYNKDLFEKAGVEAPDGPASPEEWQEIVDKLQGAGITPVATGGGTGQAGTMHFVNARLAVHASEEQYQAYLEPQIDPEVFREQPFRSALEDLIEWNDSGVFADGTATAEEAQAVSLFTSGSAAMLSIGVWGDGIIDSQDVDFDYGWMTYPSAERTTQFLSVNSGGLVVPTAAKNAQGGAAFAQFLASQEGQALIASGSSQIPSRTDIDSATLAEALLANTAEMYAELQENGEVAPWVDGRITPFLVDNLSRLLVKEITTDEFIDLLVEQLSE